MRVSAPIHWRWPSGQLFEAEFTALGAYLTSNFLAFAAKQHRLLNFLHSVFILCIEVLNRLQQAHVLLLVLFKMNLKFAFKY